MYMYIVCLYVHMLIQICDELQCKLSEENSDVTVIKEAISMKCDQSQPGCYAAESIAKRELTDGEQYLVPSSTNLLPTEEVTDNQMLQTKLSKELRVSKRLLCLCAVVPIMYMYVTCPHSFMYMMFLFLLAVV